MNGNNNRRPQNRNAPGYGGQNRSTPSRGTPNRNERYGGNGLQQGRNPYSGQPPRRRPSPEEIRRREQARREAERRAAHEKEMRRRERKRSRQVFLGRFVIFLIVLVILLALAAGLFWIMFRSTPDAEPETGKVRYYFGGSEVRTVSLEEAVADGVPFVCFNDLSDYLGMAESGGADGLKFLFPRGEAEAPETGTEEGAETEAPSHPGDSSGTGEEEYVIFPTNEKTADVNGQIIAIDGMNRIAGEEVWVSADFIEEYMRGISVTYDKDKLEIRVARIKDELNSTAEHTVYLPVEFTLKPAESLENIPETEVADLPINPESGMTAVPEETEEPVYELNFVNDLSDYEKYMDPEDRNGFLTLVNTVNHLDESYTPSDLVDCKYTAQGRSTQQLRLYAGKALEALMMEMQAAGFYNMAVYSGFRPYSYQNMLFAQYTSNEMAANPALTREEAEKIVLTYSTRPGTSEHQTGLAVDMDTFGTFSTDFQYEPEYAWLQENAWKFGFILRFPADKTDITTIQFEPWHYRYVGRYHAKKIHDAGVCLEEYVESLKQTQ